MQRPLLGNLGNKADIKNLALCVLEKNDFSLKRNHFSVKKNRSIFL